MQYGREVGVVSGPWAPQRVEQRASAFVAMLLMPASRIENMIDPDRDIEFDVVRDMAQTLRVGKTALIEHLHNIGAMTMLKRDAMREQIERNREKFEE
jgi:Zn-dependent peptidase ImmA (M78 family)